MIIKATTFQIMDLGEIFKIQLDHIWGDARPAPVVLEINRVGPKNILTMAEAVSRP